MVEAWRVCKDLEDKLVWTGLKNGKFLLKPC